MHHPDLHRAGRDDELARQELLQRLLVGVPVHRVHRRPERAQLLQEREREEIAAVQDQVGSPQPFDTRVGQDPRAAGQVRVGDDGDVHAEGPVRGLPMLPESCRYVRPAQTQEHVRPAMSSV